MNNFNIKRFLNLIKYRFNLHKRTWLLQIGGIMGIAMIITALSFIKMTEASDFEKFYQIFYSFILLLSGAYVSSRSFTEYSSTAKGFAYVMLPASNSEKFMVPALFSGILYFLIFSVLYSLLALITNVTWSVFYDFPIYVFNPFSESLIKDTGILFLFYMIIQPMFLFGSIALRKNHFILTGIGIFIASMVFTLFGLLYAKIIFVDTNNLNVSFISSDNTLLAYIAIAIFHIVLLFASYFKLKEREI